MARVKIIDADSVTDPEALALFEWVAKVEGNVPNHFLVEANFLEFFKAKLNSTRVLWENGELSMEEIQHIGVIVSRANQCEYCTAAFCTILNHGLGKEDDYVSSLKAQGVDVINDQRLRVILDFALLANNDPMQVGDEDIERLRALGLTDKGIVQLVHLVSDFASYNRINQVLKTDYDYREIWRLQT